MSDFWLGATVAFGLWQTVNLISSLITCGKTITIGKKHVFQYAALVVMSFVVANLIHLDLV